MVHRQMPTVIITTPIYLVHLYVLLSITIPKSMFAIRDPCHKSSKNIQTDRLQYTHRLEYDMEWHRLNEVKSQIIAYTDQEKGYDQGKVITVQYIFRINYYRL